MHVQDSYDYRFLTILAHDANSRDNGVRKVSYDQRTCSFRFPGG